MYICIYKRKTVRACHSNFFKMEYGKLGKMETSLEKLY